MVVQAAAQHPATHSDSGQMGQMSIMDMCRDGLQPWIKMRRYTQNNMMTPGNAMSLDARLAAGLWSACAAACFHLAMLRRNLNNEDKTFP